MKANSRPQFNHSQLTQNTCFQSKESRWSKLFPFSPHYLSSSIITKIEYWATIYIRSSCLKDNFGKRCLCQSTNITNGYLKLAFISVLNDAFLTLIVAKIAVHLKSAWKRTLNFIVKESCYWQTWFYRVSSYFTSQLQCHLSTEVCDCPAVSRSTETFPTCSPPVSLSCFSQSHRLITIQDFFKVFIILYLSRWPRLVTSAVATTIVLRYY